jgi:hypothetical protein
MDRALARWLPWQTAAYIVPTALVVLTAILQSGASRTRADDPAAGPKALSEKDKADKRMKFMLQALARYDVVYPGDPPQVARLHAKPLLRWTNPVTTIKDGTLAVYTRGGRPDVVVEFQVHNEQLAGHEFSPIRFEGMQLRRDEQTVFSADGGWFKFQDLPDAPKPADKAAQRLAQMRQIAERFTVIDVFGRFEDEVTRYNLRLMTQPVYRYEEAAEKIDGGMFVFAQGTNPEAVLLVEARQSGDKPGWRYGFAPTTTYQLTAHLGGEEGPVVWSKPRYPVFDGNSGPYLAAFYPPGPEDIDLKGLLPDPKAKGEPQEK